MGNLKVLTSDAETCGCGTPGYVPAQPSTDPADQIIVRSKPNISIGNVINEYIENGKKVYELDDYSLVSPIVNFSNDSPLIEVGETIPLVTFDGEILQGTNPIVTRSISPDPGGLNLSAPFSFQKSNVKRTSPGVAELHTVTATDDEGNSTPVSSGVYAKNAIYQGFNGASVLNETQIKALANKHLVDSVLQQYGGQKTYVVPGGLPLYIYWCGMVGSPIIGGATLNGFALPLVEVGPISVANIHDGSIIVSYWVKRTANKFDPGTYNIITS